MDKLCWSIAGEIEKMAVDLGLNFDEVIQAAIQMCEEGNVCGKESLENVRLRDLI